VGHFVISTCSPYVTANIVTEIRSVISVEFSWQAFEARGLKLGVATTH